METKNIMSIMIVALVGAIILVGFVPVIGATQENIGDPITFNNGGTNPITLDYYDEDFTLLINADGSATVGDYTVQPAANTPRVIMWEYGRISLYNTGSTNLAAVNDYRSGDFVNLTVSSTVDYDAENHTITIVSGSLTKTYEAYTVMAIALNGAYVYVPSSGIGSSYFMMKNVTDDTLGFLDTTTTYEGNTLEVVLNKSGITVFGLPEGTEYTATLDVVNAVKVDGTTDVYRGGTPTFTIVIGDDTIVESTFRYGQSVIKEVVGHQTAGAMYDVYGLIPLIVAVGLLLFVITAILIKRV